LEFKKQAEASVVWLASALGLSGKVVFYVVVKI
jgi:hypothetical protein